VGDVLTKKPDRRSPEESARVVHAVRMARRVVRDRGAVLKLFDELAPRYLARRGGYTRIVKLGQRPGDAAPMSLLELIPEDGAPRPRSPRRRRRGRVARARPRPRRPPRVAPRRRPRPPRRPRSPPPARSRARASRSPGRVGCGIRQPGKRRQSAASSRLFSGRAPATVSALSCRKFLLDEEGLRPRPQGASMKSGPEGQSGGFSCECARV
jgi:hypothetical protein